MDICKTYLKTSCRDWSCIIRLNYEVSLSLHVIGCLYMWLSVLWTVMNTWCPGVKCVALESLTDTVTNENHMSRATTRITLLNFRHRSIRISWQQVCLSESPLPYIHVCTLFSYLPILCCWDLRCLLWTRPVNSSQYL